MSILIGLITAHHESRRPYIERARKSLENSPLDYKFVFGEGEPRAEDIADSLYFPCDDTRYYMVLKNQGLFRYALENNYDFCFRACDDTVIYPERLMNACLEDFDYAGCIPSKIQCGPIKVPMRYLDYMNGGCGIWLSKKAMEMLVADEWEGPMRRFPENLDMGFGLKLNMEPIDWDDRWIGEVLKGNLAWDDPKRNNAFMAYTMNGIKVYENDLIFFNDDVDLPISIHDPGGKKIVGIMTPKQWKEAYG